MKPKQTTYDYIIIGAGPAGCIVANRLAQADPTLSILLLESGTNVPASDNTVWDPTQWALVQQQAQYEWGYQSVPQVNLNNRIIPMGRAKALGGCSVHNGMVYVRGGKFGYDAWAQEGCVGWDYESVLPYFQNVESDITITIAKEDNFMPDLFKACAQSWSLPYNANYNELACAYGCSPFQFLIDTNGRRETDYEVFIANQNLPNVEVVYGATVTNIILNGTIATGVQLSFIQGLPLVEIFANQEVILSAGSIGSPQILMLSGIGNATQLKSLGINPVINLPGVGQNLQDDLYINTCFTSSQPMPSQPYGLMGAVIFGYSSLTGTTNPNGLKTTPVLTDIECSMSSGTMPGLNLPEKYQQSYLIYPNVQLLESRGTVILASNNPFADPLIDPNYLSAPNDINRCVDALNFARTIGNSPALVNWRLAEIYPGPDVQTEQQIIDYIKSDCGTCYHYAGTCKMGIDSMSVVNPQLQVNGISRLRVIDASVIPTTVSGNTAAATMMIANKGATMVLQTLEKSKKIGK